jgi:hypothetical protein
MKLVTSCSNWCGPPDSQCNCHCSCLWLQWRGLLMPQEQLWGWSVSNSLLTEYRRWQLSALNLRNQSKKQKLLWRFIAVYDINTQNYARLWYVSVIFFISHGILFCIFGIFLIFFILPHITNMNNDMQQMQNILVSSIDCTPSSFLFIDMIN